jgi:hypothetical protein
MDQTLNEADKRMDGCVMLALSTFRKSEAATEVAMEKCREIKNLMVVYVVDINVARYLVDVEEDLVAGLRETYGRADCQGRMPCLGSLNLKFHPRSMT